MWVSRSSLQSDGHGRRKLDELLVAFAAVEPHVDREGGLAIEDGQRAMPHVSTVVDTLARAADGKANRPDRRRHTGQRPAPERGARGGVSYQGERQSRVQDHTAVSCSRHDEVAAGMMMEASGMSGSTHLGRRRHPQGWQWRRPDKGWRRAHFLVGDAVSRLHWRKSAALSGMLCWCRRLAQVGDPVVQS